MSGQESPLRFAHSHIIDKNSRLTELWELTTTQQLGALSLIDEVGVCMDSDNVANALGFAHVMSAPIAFSKAQRSLDGNHPEVNRRLIIASNHPMQRIAQLNHALAVSLQTPDRNISLMTVRLDEADEAIRLQQLGAAFSQLKPRGPSIVMGNFGAEDKSSEQNTPESLHQIQPPTRDLLSAMRYTAASDEVHYANLWLQVQYRSTHPIYTVR